MTAERGVVYRTKRIGPKTIIVERHKIQMLAQMYASEQRPIGFDQKDMMKTNRGLYQKGRNRAAICVGEWHDR